MHAIVHRKLAYLRPSLPFYAMTCYDQLHTSLQRTGSWLPFQKLIEIVHNKTRLLPMGKKCFNLFSSSDPSLRRLSKKVAYNTITTLLPDSSSPPDFGAWLDLEFGSDYLALGFATTDL